MLSVLYAECRKKAHYTERHYAECRYANCRGALTSPVPQHSVLRHSATMSQVKYYRVIGAKFSERMRDKLSW